MKNLAQGPSEYKNSLERVMTLKPYLVLEQKLTDFIKSLHVGSFSALFCHLTFIKINFFKTVL